MRQHGSIISELSIWVASNPKPDSQVARARAVAAIIDGVGCVFAGAKDPATLAVLQSTLVSHGSGKCRVFGQDVSLSPAGAALVGGTSAHALDYDDNFMPAITHATAVLVPALFVVGQMTGKSCSDIVDAYIVGLELQARVGALVNPDHYGAGWHATSTIGTIGTAGALASLMGFSADQIAMSMSVAFSLAGGSKLQFGTTTKPAHAGFAAHNAVMAVLLVQAGLTAQIEFLSGPWGFQDLFGSGSTQSPDDVTANLGQDWSIQTSGLTPKRYPCCGAAHKALDAVEVMLLDHKVGLDDVEMVTAFLPGSLYENLRFDKPSTASEGRFSFTYPAARLMLQGKLSLSDFTDDAVLDTGVQSQLHKFKRQITDQPLSEMNFKQRVHVALKNGKEINVERVYVKGSIHNPFAEQEVDQKFSDCLSWSGNMKAMPLLDRLKRFESYENIDQLFAGI